MSETETAPATGKTRRRRGRPKKESAPLADGPISVRATLKTGQNLSFTCFQQYEDGRFMVFLSPGAQGKVLKRRISLEALAMIEIEEFPVPSYQPQPQPQPVQYYQPQPMMVSQNTAPKSELSLSPGMLAKKGLQSIVRDGVPMSELPDGTVVPAGFLS